MLSQAGVGVNKGVGIGNKTEVDEADHPETPLQDEGTGMVFLCIESIGDGRRLVDLARTSAQPIVVHKANRVLASQAVAFSHRAAWPILFVRWRAYQPL
jgi:acyl-CoA synthetase (NDP forming)